MHHSAKSIIMTHRSALAVVVLFTAACGDGRTRLALTTPSIDTLPGGIVRVRNAGPTAWTTDTSGWRLIEDLTITGAGDSVAELSDPSGLAVDSAGRIYVSDGLVKLFAPDGRFLRVIGREGAGPGEYRGADIATLGDQLVLEDLRASRLSVFDSSGKYLRSWTISCCAPSPPAVDSTGRILVRVPAAGLDEGRDWWLRFASYGGTPDTVSAPHGPQSPQWKLKTGAGGWSGTIPFTPMGSVAPSMHGGLLYGWGGKYEIIRTRNGRDTTLLFGRSWTPGPVSDARRKAAVDYYVSFLSKNGRNMGGVDSSDVVKTFHLGDVPSTAPAFTALREDSDGNVWVFTDPGDDTLHTSFDVFDATGSYLGPVRAPTPLKSYLGYLAWGKDVLYAIEQTGEGLPVVRRYRIVKSPTKS